MSREEEYYGIFDRYLEGSLADQERLNFETQLESDDELREWFEAYKAEVQLIRTMAVRQEMGDILNKSTGPKTIAIKWLIPLAVAASVALALVFFYPSSRPGNVELFEQSFKPFPNLISVRQNLDSVGMALRFYDQQAYPGAIEVFEQLSIANDTVQFYKGMSYLSVKQPENALVSFSQMDESSMFYGTVAWYKALAHLLLSNSDSVIYYLNQADVQGEDQATLDLIKESLKD